jgi:flagellar hook-basal body complex protein FliE
MRIDSIDLSQAAGSPMIQMMGTAPATQTFGSMLVDGATGVDRALQSASSAVTVFATGADVPPHQVMLALEDARLQLQFALQVRSKLVEGYQELMRMQI